MTIEGVCKMTDTHDTQRRYTDGELITLLRILASDYNSKPTQRAILDDDRMPTHHTFNKRFGGIENALVAAGLGDLHESTLHESTKAMFEHYGLSTCREWAPVGPLIADFVVEDSDKVVHYVDVVEMLGTQIGDEVADMRWVLSEPYAQHYHQIRDIGDAVRLTDALSSGTVITDIGSE
jgi:hypothetical protein